MWRNDLAGARDMYLMNSKDNGRTFDEPIKLGMGTWPLDVCPMDGGGIAAGSDGYLMTIWRRKDQIFRCLPGVPEIPLGTGMQGCAAAGPRGIYYVWLTGRPGSLQFLSPGQERPSKPSDAKNQIVDPVISSSVNGKGPGSAIQT